jgi:hypothetical protein
MKTNRLTTLATAAFIALSTVTTHAQTLKVPAPSPTQTIKQAFGLGEITIEYSRPLAKGRVIFGDLVPYGKIWRTGANAATKITFTDDVSFEGRAVKAGTYAIYTVPTHDAWDIMLYKDLALGGNTANYKTEDEILRVRVEARDNSRMVQNFTINIDNITASTATLQFMWERTLVPVRIKTDIDTRVMSNIVSVMKVEDSRPYFQAANYYYENDKDLSQALTWVNKAIDQNRAFYVVHLKAKILMKMKNYNGAIEAAQESLSLAREAKSEDYIALNEKLIASARKAQSGKKA